MDNICQNCCKEITLRDFENEDEAMLCSPRAFIGKGFSNFSWPVPEELREFCIYMSLCKKCRELMDATHMVRMSTSVDNIKEWIKEMKMPS